VGKEIKRYAGANIPDWVFKAMQKSKLDDFSGAEQKILDIVNEESGPYYLIATADDCMYVRDHEIAHAMWYLDKEYQTKARAIVDKYLDQIPNVVSHLATHYSGEVLIDEVHAYAGVYSMYLNAQLLSYPLEMHKKLRDLFDEYVDKYKPRLINYE
jgi:hypothetical protein